MVNACIVVESRDISMIFEDDFEGDENDVGDWEYDGKFFYDLSDDQLYCLYDLIEEGYPDDIAPSTLKQAKASIEYGEGVVDPQHWLSAIGFSEDTCYISILGGDQFNREYRYIIGFYGEIEDPFEQTEREYKQISAGGLPAIYEYNLDNAIPHYD